MGKNYSELDIEADVAKLPKMMAFLEEALEAAGCSAKAQMQICIAAEEIFVNIANYAYAPGKGMAKVCLQISDDPREAVISFADSGVPFDPLAKEDPDVTLSVEERGIGGLGIFMTKKTMDEVRYEYCDGKNILTVRKAI